MMPTAIQLWNQKNSKPLGGVRIGSSGSGNLSAVDIWATRNDPKLRESLKQGYALQRQQNSAEEERKRIQQLEAGLSAGKSWEDISRETGINIDEVKSYSQRTRPDYGKSPSNVSKVGGAIESVAQGIAQPFERAGVGIARALPGGTADLQAAERASQQQAVDIKNITDALKKKGLTPVQKSRLRQLLQERASGSANQELASVARQVQDEADKSSFIGSIAAIGSYAIPIGGAANLAKGAKAVLPTVGKGAFSGVVGGAGYELSANPKSSTKDIVRSALVGGVLGGAVPLGGAYINKVKTDKAARRVLQKEAVNAGGLSSDLENTLKGFNVDKDLSNQIKATFGSKSQQRAVNTATRKGEQTSRVKQFYDIGQKEVIDQLESDPSIVRSGQVQSQVETITQAVNRGPIDLTKVQLGQKMDAIDVARARLSMSDYIDNYVKAVQTKDGKLIKQSYDSLAKAREGYQLITGEAGRALNIQNTFDERMSNFTRIMQDYQNTIDSGQALTIGQKDYLNQLLKDAADAATQPRLNKAVNYIYAGDQSLIRKAEEYATAAKLTSPITHLRNVIGNTLTFGQRAVDQGFGNVVGAVRGRTSIRSVPRVLGTVNGYKTATAKFTEIMKDAILLRPTGVESADRLAREGYKQAIGGRKGEFIRIPFKFLEAADEFGKTILRDSKINQEAFSIASKEGFKGRELINRVDELIRKPTQQMLASAEKDALEHTFQAPLGKASSKVSQAIQAVPGGKFFVPFFRTPTNIIKFQAKRSIVGTPYNIAQAVAKRGTREGDEAIARAITGTMFSLGTYQWVTSHADQITGAAPKSQAERDAFYAEGKQPYSIKIGNRWISYQSFQPVGLYLLQAKALDDSIKNKDNQSAFSIAASMSQVAAKGVSELPFVQGLNSAFELLGSAQGQTDAQQQRLAENFIGGVVKGFVPNIARDVRLYTDEIIRAPKNLKEQIYDMLPGLSKTLEARKNILGEDVKRQDSPLSRSFLRAFGTTTQQSNQGLKTLEEVAQKTEYSPANPSKTQRGQKLNEQDYSKYQNIYSSKFKDNLYKVINKSEFKNASIETKKDIIQQLVYISGNQARDEFFGEKPQNRGRNIKESTQILQGAGLR